MIFNRSQKVHFCKMFNIKCKLNKCIPQFHINNSKILKISKIQIYIFVYWLLI